MSAYAVIMAGGTGTRLWPYSRRSRPKQLLPLLGEQSLLQATVARLSPAVDPAHVIIVTNREYVPEVRQQLPEVPPTQIVGEPEALGTAAAVGLGVALVKAQDPDATVFVLPADHVIEPATTFHDDMERADETARAGYLVTFGIPPTGPETGFGYVELGSKIAAAALSDANVFEVERFVEKPDRDTAQRYVDGGRHLWNSGMFAWTVPTIERAMHAFLPSLAEQVVQIAATAASGELDDRRLAMAWARIEDRTTIDYGVMERSDNVACVPARFEWNDVGSWAALADVLPADESGNIVVGRHADHDCTGCVVYGAGDRLVATVGLENLVVVDTDDALLIIPRDRAQDVREIVAMLKDGAADLL